MQLTVHPKSGSVVPEFGRNDIRELFTYSFRLIYRIASDEIRVLTVIHGSRIYWFVKCWERQNNEMYVRMSERWKDRHCGAMPVLRKSLTEHALC